jgi:hypothetical protein
VVVCNYECKQISLVNCGVLTVGGVSGFVYGKKSSRSGRGVLTVVSNFVNNFTAVCNTALCILVLPTLVSHWFKNYILFRCFSRISEVLNLNAVNNASFNFF